MVSSCNNEVTLVCTSGETLQVSQNILMESSNYLSQVLSTSLSTVLLFPDVNFEDLNDLIKQVESGSTFDENLSEIAVKYGFKNENVEAHLPLKKRPLEHSPPSSPELVIDETYSPRKVSPSSPKLVSPLVIDESYSPRQVSPTLQRSVSPESETSLAPFLPWPLLLQQVAKQNSHKDLDETSILAVDSKRSSLFDPLEFSENVNGEALVSCNECGKTFKHQNLRLHMRRVHRVLQKPVKCCGQDFPTRWHLTEHRKSGDHLPTLWKTENGN